MVKNIKVVDIAQDTANENEEGKTQEEVPNEVVDKVDDVVEAADDAIRETSEPEIINTPEIIKDVDKPKKEKTITCPDAEGLGTNAATRRITCPDTEGLGTNAAKRRITCPDTEGLGTNAAKRRITCPDCGKCMLERTFRHKHINICGKPKASKARPIEEVIKEKREKTESRSKPSQPSKPVEVEQPPPPPLPVAKPTYWELRKEYNNQLHERKINLVKKLVSSAF
jgi:cell division septation protein DedD